MNKHVASGYVLAPDLEARLQRVAQRTKDSPTKLLEVALNYFLNQVETDEEIVADTDAAVREWEETGLHVTGEEVEEWLRRRASGEDVPPPKAHT